MALSQSQRYMIRLAELPLISKTKSAWDEKIRTKTKELEISITGKFKPYFENSSRLVGRTTTGVLLLALVSLSFGGYRSQSVTGGAKSGYRSAPSLAVTKDKVTASLALFSSQPAVNEIVNSAYASDSSGVTLVDRGVLGNSTPIGTDGLGWKADVRQHTVTKGQTLGVIAEKYKVTTGSIYWLNGIKNADMIKVGQVINVPPVSGLVHKVSKGDTLETIAKKYKVKATDVTSYNDLTPGALALGKELLIPGASKDVPHVAAPSTGSSSGYGGVYGSRTPSWGGGNFIQPTSTRGYNGYHWWALDIPGSHGQAIWASDSGRITTASYGWNGGYGNYIVIDHGNGFQSLYAHNSSLAVTGGYVSKGQVIAYMGCTGRTWGPNGCGIHLHFEIHKNGAQQNPNWYL